MLARDEQDHTSFASLADTDHDGIVTAAEIERSSLVQSMIGPDVTMFANGTFGPVRDDNNRDSLSFGFAVHLIPCDSGDCAVSSSFDACHDRIVDGDETDLDCGGSCAPCVGGASCAVASDCATNACDGGTCRAPSCSDGIRDGFEQGVDCDGGCPACS
jgi:hypothetical protein